MSQTSSLPPQYEEFKQEAVRVAAQLYEQKPNWMMFFREILGLEGVIRQLFTNPEAIAEFERSAEYKKIQGMLADLRQQSEEEVHEPTRVITVRLPRSLHESLRAEAHEQQTSMNKLCITKLLNVAEEAPREPSTGRFESASNDRPLGGNSEPR
jgi:predicted HicB family RNase H-like nuclease